MDPGLGFDYILSFLYGVVRGGQRLKRVGNRKDGKSVLIPSWQSFTLYRYRVERARASISLLKVGVD